MVLGQPFTRGGCGARHLLCLGAVAECGIRLCQLCKRKRELRVCFRCRLKPSQGLLMAALPYELLTLAVRPEGRDRSRDRSGQTAAFRRRRYGYVKRVTQLAGELANSSGKIVLGCGVGRDRNRRRPISVINPGTQMNRLAHARILADDHERGVTGLQDALDRSGVYLAAR